MALILNMSERGVREVEHRALRKLRAHPLLKQLWHDYLAGALDEARARLTRAEIVALFDLAYSLAELRLIEKVLRIVQY